MSLEQSLDFTKLYCQLHPCELITNYCNDERCLVGLCATCICSHTEIHAQLGTVPQYQNIRDTFCILHDELRNQVAHIQEDKCKLGSVRQAIEVKKITIRKAIRQLKEDTVSKIREEFDFLEKKIMADISSEEKKQGYHSNIRFESLEKNLARQTETLLSYIEGLNSPCFLDWAKKLKREALMESNDIRLKIEKEIEDNETYTANIKWSPTFLPDVENAVRKVFTLEFVIPKHNGEPKNCITIFRPANLNVSSISLSRASSQPKISQNLMKSSSMLGLNKFSESTSYSSFFPEADKYSSGSLQKQSIVRKNNSIISEVFQPEMKENLARSSYISSDELFGRQSMINNLSAFMRPSYQNDKLSSLIQAKRSTGFDGQRISTLIKDEGINDGSRVRMY